MDVNNTFLHGDIYEDVFMNQPPDFINLTIPFHVYELKNALYGLKQAPHA